MCSRLLWCGLACAAAIAFGDGGRASAADQLALRAEGEQRSLDCKGLDVVIEGNRNTYTLRGGCNSLTLRGEADHVRAAMVPGARITVEGNENELSWSVVGTGPEPVVSVNGRDSVATREGNAPNPEASLRLLTPPRVAPPTPPEAPAVPLPPQVATANPPASQAVKAPPPVPVPVPALPLAVPAPPPAAPASLAPQPSAPADKPPAPAAKAIFPPIEITLDRETRDLDCSGRDVHIKADHGLYALRGGCTAVIVHGDDDLVQAEVEPGAKIELVGKGTNLAFVQMGAGAAPSVHTDGADSKAWAIKNWGAWTGEIPK